MSEHTEEQTAETELFVRRALSHISTRRISDRDCREVAMKVLDAVSLKNQNRLQPMKPAGRRGSERSSRVARQKESP